MRFRMTQTPQPSEWDQFSSSFGVSAIFSLGIGLTLLAGLGFSPLVVALMLAIFVQTHW